MEQTMGWSKSPDRTGISPKDTIEQFREPVCDVVRSYREEHGVKKAIALGAETLGIPARRVRACWNNEVRTVFAHELQQVRRGYRCWCWDMQMRLAHKIGVYRQKLRELGEDDE